MRLFTRSLSSNVRWSYSAKSRILSFPALADVNGDGIPEVVFGSDDHMVYAVRGNDGSVAWNFLTDGPMRSSPAVADVNRDGICEVVFGCEDSTVYALNGVDGRVVWAAKCDGPIRSAPAIGDIDCDGRVEVVVTTYDSCLHAIDAETGELIWQSSHRGEKSGALVQSCPCLVDLDGDGRMEIVTGSASNNILVFDPDGSLRIRKEFEPPSFNASIAAADMNGDRRVELVACADNGTVYVMDPECETLWSRVVGTRIRSSPVLGDVNGDGMMEILVHVDQEAGAGALVCLSPDGEMLWEKPLSGHGGASPVPVDVNADGAMEIPVFADGKEIRVLGPNGDGLETIGARGEALCGPAIGDVDGNGEIEFIYGSSDGAMVCVGSRYGSGHCDVLSSRARGDLRNSGVYRTVIQAIANLKEEAQDLKNIGGESGPAIQKILKAEREQGMRDVSGDLEDIGRLLLTTRFRLTQGRRRGERLASVKSKLKYFSSLDLDGSSQLSVVASKIERMLAQGQDAEQELLAAESIVETLEQKGKEKIQALNAKRLSFLVGQFLEKFPDPSESDMDEFIQYLKSEKLPFLPYEIRTALEKRKNERKFQSLRDSGRLDFMSEEEKVIAIGIGLAEAIIHDIKDGMAVPIGNIQQRMNEVSVDYPNAPKLVLTDEGKILTDELRKALGDAPPQKFISVAVSLFCLYITKLFDLYQELTDFETAYSKFKTNMDYLTQVGAEEIVAQFQEKACHGIFAEDVRVRKILDL